ncbi:MAG TPA: hypothetical protein VF505_19035 [Thermoanaerobaculia bacterium]
MFDSCTPYLGLLFAPSIIFFSFSGALQLFGLHEVRKSDTFSKPRWIGVLDNLQVP